MIKIVTEKDVQSGLYYAKVYYPEDEPTPAFVTKPLYESHDQAATDIVEIFKRNAESE
jgi:hypothetical protein